VPDLTCPLCKESVPATSAACLSCHLPIRDVVRHRESAHTSRGRAFAREVRLRVTGLVLYAAAVAWCASQLPTSLAFVVPGAVLGGMLHVWKGRPWLGLLVFTVVVVVVPALFWPSLLTGTFAGLTDGV
jgi:hypothetical protein